MGSGPIGRHCRTIEIKGIKDGAAEVVDEYKQR